MGFPITNYYCSQQAASVSLDSDNTPKLSETTGEKCAGVTPGGESTKYELEQQHWERCVPLESSSVHLHGFNCREPSGGGFVGAAAPSR